MFPHAIRRSDGFCRQMTLFQTASSTSRGGKPSAATAPTPTTMQITTASGGASSGRQGQLGGGGSRGVGLGMTGAAKNMGVKEGRQDSHHAERARHFARLWKRRGKAPSLLLAPRG